MRNAFSMAFGVLVTAAALSPATRAATLFTTGSDFAGFTTTDAGFAVAPSAVVGDTDLSTTNGLGNAAPGTTGTPGALQLTLTAGGYKQAFSGNQNNNLAFINEVKNNNKITFDYTLPQTITTGAGEYFQLLLVFNFQGGYLSANNNAAFAGAGLTAGTHSVTIDYSAVQAQLPSAVGLQYYQLGVIVNTSGTLGGLPTATSVSVDNFRTPVPEPTVLTASALAGVGLLRRRRA